MYKNLEKILSLSLSLLSPSDIMSIIDFIFSCSISSLMYDPIVFNFNKSTLFSGSSISFISDSFIFL